MPRHERTYELRLTDGRRVLWDGPDGEAAARRYVDAHPGARVAVLAWRSAPRHGFFPHVDPRRIVP